jgi:hypothetical protein
MKERWRKYQENGGEGGRKSRNENKAGEMKIYRKYQWRNQSKEKSKASMARKAAAKENNRKRQCQYQQ